MFSSIFAPPSAVSIPSTAIVNLASATTMTTVDGNSILLNLFGLREELAAAKVGVAYGSGNGIQPNTMLYVSKVS